MALWSIPSIETDDHVITATYDATGLIWVKLWDNTLEGWVINDADPAHPQPIILQPLPPAAPDVPPIQTPRWVHQDEGGIIAPDISRGTLAQALTWLCIDQGANRRIACYFLHPQLRREWNEWAGVNPARVVVGSPTEADEPQVGERPSFDRLPGV